MRGKAQPATAEQSQVTQTSSNEMEVPARNTERPPVTGKFSVVSGDSNDKDPEDPMVSDPI